MRRLLVAALILLFSLPLAGAFSDLPPPEWRIAHSDMARHVIDKGTDDTGAANLVSAVLFDYRGFDTFGEATVIFAAVAGVVMLFYRDPLPRSTVGLSMLVKRSLDVVGPFVFAAGMYVILYGHVSPGGGFQGGVVVATLTILIAIVYGLEVEKRIIEPGFKILLESSSALAFLAMASVGMVTGEYFLSNLSAGYPAGEAGTLISAGALPGLNLAIGLKVAAGFALIFYSMIKRETQ